MSQVPEDPWKILFEAEIAALISIAPNISPGDELLFRSKAERLRRKADKIRREQLLND